MLLGQFGVYQIVIALAWLALRVMCWRPAPRPGWACRIALLILNTSMYMLHVAVYNAWCEPDCNPMEPTCQSPARYLFLLCFVWTACLEDWPKWISRPTYRLIAGVAYLMISCYDSVMMLCRKMYLLCCQTMSKTLGRNDDCLIGEKYEQGQQESRISETFECEKREPAYFVRSDLDYNDKEMMMPRLTRAFRRLEITDAALWESPYFGEDDDN